jgi:hypothetical protein
VGDDVVHLAVLVVAVEELALRPAPDDGDATPLGEMDGGLAGTVTPGLDGEVDRAAAIDGEAKLGDGAVAVDVAVADVADEATASLLVVAVRSPESR